MMSLKWTLASVGLLLLAGLCGAQKATEREFPLRYRVSDGLQSEVGWLGGQHIQALKAKPILEAEPKYASKKPLYFTAKLGCEENEYTLVLDESKGTGKGYDVLYIDLNRDQIISDSEKLHGMRMEGALCFGPVRVKIKSGDGEYLYHFCIRLNPWDRNSVSLQAACYLIGDVQFNGKTRKIAVVDVNGNGRFNDFGGEDEWRGDRIMIDLNEDGRFNPDWQSPEIFPNAKLVQVDGKYYTLEVAPDGSTVKVITPELTFGTLFSTSKAFEVTLTSPERGMLRLKAQDGKTPVPTGKYQVQAYTIETKDNKGNVWKLMTYGGSKPIEIKEGQATKLAVGFPLKTKLSTWEGRGQVSISVSLVGSSGESVSSVTINDNRPPVPKLKIFTTKGKLVGTYDLHYG